jgi:hypothetical protein
MGNCNGANRTIDNNNNKKLHDVTMLPIHEESSNIASTTLNGNNHRDNNHKDVADISDSAKTGCDSFHLGSGGSTSFDDYKHSVRSVRSTNTASSGSSPVSSSVHSNLMRTHKQRDPMK